MTDLNRKAFLQTCLVLPAIGFPALREADPAALPAMDNRFRLSLNAYSFNAPLSAGQTTLEQVMDFCASTGFDAIDLTGYYFPGYPASPSDEFIFRLKRKAHRLGLAISGTGIRNEFAVADKIARTEDVALVMRWIDVAAKLGAPVIRIYTGKTVPEGISRTKAAEWIVESIRSCVEYGRSRGVIVAIQNHNDFIKTAAQALELIKQVNSEWFGLVLDTGSFVTKEPYGEIASASPYAVNWQIKEKLTYQNQTQDMDLDKLFRIIQASPYRGYLPIETLSAGDPFKIVPPFLQLVRTAMEKTANSPAG